ncbi:hypothetical protein DdX_10492 [Ditylenchus destructor]|uniref:Uncharacterized protein n=1 Tax=Ditylenchus destructor TaxID=166010 RepID=A0AAD4MXX1_9BILA|nr:hypothetical protein DdX_10492 [Ditylenchus destructor]
MRGSNYPTILANKSGSPRVFQGQIPSDEIDSDDESLTMGKDAPAASAADHAPNPGFSGFPEAINPGNRRCSLRSRYQSTQLADTKRFTYHTPGPELRLEKSLMEQTDTVRLRGSR